MVKIKINGKEIEVEEGLTILKAAKKLGIKIPSLCYHPDIPPTSACGICVVKLANQGNKYVRSCSMIVEEGMDIITHDAEINTVRKGVLELVLSAHPNDCLNCIRNGECELQVAAADFGVRNSKYDNIKQNHPRDESAGSIVLNPEKCIKCGRCVVVCQQMQNVHALGFVNRGFETYFAPSAVSLKDSPCVDCGQCAAHCPVAAIYEKDQTKEVEDAIDDADTFEYSIPGSFREALFNFIFNCALAYSRGDENNYSMLVHPSSLKRVHNDISSKISEYINKVLNTILSDPRNFSYNSIKKSFYDEYKKYTNNYSTSLTFDKIFANLSYVLQNIKSFIYNSDTDSDEIENDAHKYKILIGGNMLGRGLTIERLIITYIYRDSKISPIDTLYQRARWFGYKQSYFDLCKVYLTYELDQKFRSIVDCENDLRSSLESFLETNINAKEFKRLFKVNNDHLILTRPSVSKTISLVRVNPGYTYDKSVNFKKDQLFNNKKLFEKYFSSHKLQGHEENFSLNNNQIHYIIPTTYTKFYEDFLSKYELPFGSKFGQLGFKNLLEQAKEGKISDKFTVIIMRYKTKQYRSMNPNKFIKELPQSYDESTRYPGDKMIKPFCNQFSIQIHLVYTDEEHPEDYIPLLA